MKAQAVKKSILAAAMLAAMLPAVQSHANTVAAPTFPPSCAWPSWVCSNVNYGDAPPPTAPHIQYVNDYQNVLSCFTGNRLDVNTTPGGTVRFVCPSWPEPIVTRGCPTNEVIRVPYPRALVSLPVTLSLNVDSSWVVSSSTLGPSTQLNSYPKDAHGTPLVHGAVGYVTLSVRGRRMTVAENWFGDFGPQPRWTIHERAINGGVQTRTGMSMTHTFQTSSFGLPANGRAFDLALGLPAVAHNLPAYRIQTETPCVYETRITVEKAWPYYSASQNRWMPQYVAVSSAWSKMNLRVHGAPQSYEWWNATRTGGTYDSVQYWDNFTGETWVPVIEAQTVQQ